MTRAARRGEAAYAAVYGGLFMAMGAQIAFLQIWLEEWGLGPAEIGWVHAAGVALRIGVGVGAPALADRLGRPGSVMIGAALLGALAGGGLYWAESRAAVYLLAVLVAVAPAALIPLSDAHGYASGERLGFSYRRARSVGSFAFLLATFLCGVTVDAFGPHAILVWIAIPFLATALAAGPAPTSGAVRPRGVSADALSERWSTAPRFLMFLLAVAAIQSSHGVYYVYGSIHWRALGWSDSLIGALWSWGVLVEIAVFFLGARLMARLGPAGALALAGAAAALRWGVMSLDPPLGLTILLQSLHGITFGLTHLAALAFAQAAAPPDRVATAQGLVSASAGGVGMLLATLAAAEAYPVYGGGAYLLGAGFGLIGLLAALRLGRMRPGRAS